MDLIAVIAAIVFGIISFLSGRDEEKSKPVAKPAPTPSGPEPTVNSSPSSEKEIREIQPAPADDIHEHNHYDRSEDRPVYMDEDITKSNPINKPQTRLKSRGSRNKSSSVSSPISIKEQMNQKRLVESLIMSEVLGPSRAHKPYRSREYRK